MTDIFKRIGMYAVPLLAVGAVIGGLFIAFSESGRPRRRGPEGLVLLCDEYSRYPVEAPDMEHESGIIGRFLRRTGVRVRPEYGPAPELVNELIVGREGDILMIPGDDYLERAKEAGLIYHTRRVATLVPVMLVRGGNPRDIKNITDLVDPELRLAVADDRKSLLGQISDEVFQKNGINIHSLGNIRFVGDGASEVASAVVTDRADVAILWRPVAARHSRNTEILKIASEQNVTSPLVIAVLETSVDKEKALRFADFAAGSAASEVFEMYAFDIEPPD